jgi:hypothetical protein
MIHELIDSVMTMKMDIYRQSDTQDPNSGAIKKEWNYSKTIACHAKGVISNSATTRSSDRQSFDNRYANEQLVQVRTSERIFANEKITNITDSTGMVIWKELNYPTETPTVFEVVGVTPMTDALGRVVGYSTNLKRSENQIIGL